MTDDIVEQVRRFVAFWWEDPMAVGRVCAAWDALPEDVRMWVLGATATSSTAPQDGE